MLGPATAAALGVAAVEKKLKNTLFKLPEFVDSSKKRFRKHWDC